MPTPEITEGQRILLRYLADVRLTPPTPAQCVGTGKVLPGTPSEVERELGILVAAGYVRHEDNRYEATDEGRRRLRRL